VGYTNDLTLYKLEDEEFFEVKFTIKAISPFEFYIDPYVEDWGEHQFVYVLHSIPAVIAKKLYGIEKTAQPIPTPFTSDQQVNTVQILEYYDFEKIVVMDTEGNVLEEKENFYGRLPIFGSPFIRVPGRAYGFSLIEEVRPLIVLQNLLLTIVMHEALAGNLLIVPQGAIAEGEITLSPGIQKIEINPMMSGAITPRVESLSKIDAQTISVFDAVNAIYNRLLHLSSIDLGLARASESGRARELQKLVSAQMKAVPLEQLTRVYEDMFTFVLTLANKDHLGYFKRHRYFTTQDGARHIVLNYTKIPKPSDIRVRVTLTPDISQPSAIGDLLLAHSLDRLKQNPADRDARDMLKRLLAQTDKTHLLFEDDSDSKAISECIKDLRQFAKDLRGFPTHDELQAGASLTPEQQEKLDKWRRIILSRWQAKPYHNHELWISRLKDLALSPEVIKNWHPLVREVIDALITQHMGMRGGVWSEQGSPQQKLLQAILQKQQGGIES